MADNCCSRNSSSRSFRHCQPYSGSPCGSSYPSNLVYTTTSCSPSPCQVESSVNTGCQETCIEPSSCQRSCVVTGPDSLLLPEELHTLQSLLGNMCWISELWIQQLPFPGL
ncbi:Keratin-associated protein 13-3 [Microtus ochrogaster]|uniref:Keratin-associated protein n=1 Tax=Microtus ochrogaster TaxID=79684 RepID=A0A8J6G5G9_MICOH|nr:Keratin-associated protein 13-3 [Microtus ochrogaster]